MDPLKPIIDALHNEGRLRVWSLVITVFGDSVQRRGAVISNTRLQMLLGRIGVERGTLRTALSRLAKDGWLETERTGRASCYRLSKSGVAKFADATGRIYAPVNDAPVKNWSLSFGRALTGIEIAPNVFLCPEDHNTNGPPPECRVRGTLDVLSPRLRKNLMTADHADTLAAMLRDVSILRNLVLDPLSSAAARTLLIHRWRRLVLRFPEIPLELLPNNMMISPRAQVRDVYRALTPQTEQWLASSEGSLKPMPAPDATRRF